MKRRMMGILLALVLAILGTGLLVAYVNSAKNKAVKQEQQVKILVVNKTIRQGTPISEIASSVILTDVPRRLASSDALSELATLSANLVAGIELHQGEQLFRSRLVDARTLVRAEVPAGLQEITIALPPERAVGSDLRPGVTVGVLFSFAPFDAASSGIPEVSVDPAAAVTRTPNTTHFALHRILVTGIQFSMQDSERAAAILGTPTDGQTTDTTVLPTVAEAPADQLLVTLAVTAPEAEQLVFAAEFGSIWLTAEGLSASPDGTRILTLSQVYVPVPR